jgi:hypothetical protein
MKKIEVSVRTLEKLKRIKALVGKSLDESLSQVLDEYLERHDPVKKAERALRGKSAAKRGRGPKREHALMPEKSLCTYRVVGKSTRKPLVHQLSFGIDGQVTWLRESPAPYCSSARAWVSSTVGTRR